MSLGKFVIRQVGESFHSVLPNRIKVAAVELRAQAASES